MKQPELPLYPKISSIYNKIMQLGIAIVLIIGVMNLWLALGEKDKNIIDEHFSKISHQYLSQAGLGLQVLLTSDEPKIQEYIDKLARVPFINTVNFYDDTGQVIFYSSKNDLSKNSNPPESNITNPSSINDLFGISPNTINLSQKYIPIVQEIRTDKLLGYLRFTIEKNIVEHRLVLAGSDRQDLIRLMMIMAGMVGFLVTRGLSRFSRQGYRLPNAK